MKKAFVTLINVIFLLFKYIFIVCTAVYILKLYKVMQGYAFK